MSITRALLASGLLLAVSSTAHAQFVSGQGDQADEGVSASVEESPATDLDLRLTLSSFAYGEFAGEAEGLIDGGDTLLVASPYRRVLGDLRLELAAEHIAGTGFDSRVDARVRHVNRGDVQSGFRGDDEFDLRELAVSYGGKKQRIGFGRQRILAVDASKIDGISYTRESKGPWSLVFFGGTYPTRGSRSIDQDYPKQELVDGQPSGKRVVPAIIGAGASYARAKVHGDIGTGAIVPVYTYGSKGSKDRPQVFVHSKGYWRLSSATTFYHYATADLASQEGSALRNASAALTSQAAEHILLHASVHHQSTELLQESVVNQLEDPDTESMGLVQNGLSFVRVASQSARAAVSLDALSRRLQFTLQAGLRQRPDVSLELADGSSFEITTSRSSEFTLMMLDRRFPLGLRLGGQVSLLQGLGKNDLATTSGVVGGVEISRAFWEERGEFSVDAAAQSLKDSDRLGVCDPSNALSCYGRSKVTAAQLGVQASLQSAKNWLLLLDGHWGIERVESHDAMEQPIKLPTVQSIAAFVRLQYRFH